MKSNFELIDKHKKRLSILLGRFFELFERFDEKAESYYEEGLLRIRSYASSAALGSVVKENLMHLLSGLESFLYRLKAYVHELFSRIPSLDLDINLRSELSKRWDRLISWLKEYRFAPLLIFFGVIMMSISFVHRFTYYRALAFDEKQVDEYTSATQERERLAEPTHIFIEWYVDVGIEEEVFSNGEWTVSENQASHLASSARPGEEGNIIMYGHNKREILGNIRALKGYEKIRITTEDGSEHWYKVESLHEVKPTDVSWLQPTNEEVLTIYTCSGFMDKNRFIMRAHPL